MDSLAQIYEFLKPEAILLVLRGEGEKAKAPLDTNWPELSFAETHSAQYHKRLRSARAIGVRLGSKSGDICDIDVERDDWIAPLTEVLPSLAATLRTKGAKGAHFWVKIVGEYPHKIVKYYVRKEIEAGGKDHVAEFRTDGCQSVIWGQHPNGHSYQTLVASPVIEISWEELARAFAEIGWIPSEEAKALRAKERTSGAEKPKKAAAHQAQKTTHHERLPIEPQLWARIKAYLDKCDPAISGENGHDTTFRITCTLVRGFGLCRGETLTALDYYNAKCKPPWSEEELAHKADSAFASSHEKPPGYLLVSLEDEKDSAEVGEETRGQIETPEWQTDPLPLAGKPSALETLLDSMEAEYLAFFDMTVEQADSCVLWVPTTYFMDVWQIHPYLGITAATKNSGKTTLLTFTSKFCYRPWLSTNITGATVYRVVHEYRPSMFVDEMADTFAQKPDVKTIFKAAYTRANAFVPRMERFGNRWLVVNYNAWCAKAFDLLGRIGSYDDAIEERTIEIHLHKETKAHRNFWEEVMSKNPTLFVPYQRQLFHYRKEHLDRLKEHDAALPKFANSRIRENWRAPFTIAGLSGSKWLEKAHAAAESIQKGQLPELPEPEYLASALRKLVRNHPELIEQTARGKRFLPTKHILEGRGQTGIGQWTRIGLKSDKEAPWADRQPDGLTEHRLAMLLASFRVKSVLVRIGDPIRGYMVDELEEKVFTSITAK